jgi:hypothetical protein
MCDFGVRIIIFELGVWLRCDFYVREMCARLGVACVRLLCATFVYLLSR